MTTSPHSLDEAAFIGGYIRAMLWAENDEADAAGGEPIDKNYSEDDIPAADRQNIERDCQAFISRHGDLLDQAVMRTGYASERAGHDFWLTRQGHGAGYWDREELEAEGLGDQLTAACKAFGQHFDGPYVEAGQVYYGRSKHAEQAQIAAVPGLEVSPERRGPRARR